MRISVAVNAKLHGFQLAQQLQNRNALHILYTSFYGRFFGKDNSVGYNLNSSKIKTNLISAIMTYGIKFNDQLKSYKYFGNWVANKLTNEEIIICWGLSALPIIKQTKKLKIISIVERGSSHVNFQRDILFEEYRMFNADTSDLEKSFTNERMERETLEYELADYITVPSSFAEQTFIENGINKKKLIKIPYGVNLNEFKPETQRNKKFRVLFIGTMSLRKGVHYLLKAFAELKLPDAELWLIGEVLLEIKPFFKRYEDSFKHFNPISQHDLVELYNKSSVFAICSIEEGMAMVQVQALACGLPLICTTNTGGDDLIEEGKEGFIIPIRDVQALKEKIEFLYSNRDICLEMGEQAIQKVKGKFSWDNYGEKIYNTYDEIIRKSE